MTYQKRNQLERKMREARIDALLVTSPAGVFHLSGAWINSQRLIQERIAAVLWRLGDDPILLINELEEGSVKPQTWIADIRLYEQFAPGPAQALVELVRSALPEKECLGIEDRSLARQHAEALSEHLPRLALRGFDAELDTLLAVKQDWEVDRLAENARHMSDALTAAAAAARAGLTERDIGTSMLLHMTGSGKGQYSEMGALVASGPNARVTHYGMGDRSLAAGDFVRLGCRGVFRGYHGIVARSAVVGSPTPAQERIYADLQELYRELLRGLRPGACARDLYEASKRAYAERGHVLALPHVGHSVGLRLQERPQFHPFSEDTLSEGMVCIALAVVADETSAKFYLEDMVRVTERGGELLGGSRVPPGLLEIAC